MKDNCRNFADMDVMQNRIVNIILCEPLPQVKK